MANISTSSILDKQTRDLSIINNYNTLFTFPFSEQDVLILQETFVALGVHVIKTKNVIDGRRIMQTILKSLNYYRNIGCVTNMQGLSADVCDVISHIVTPPHGNLLESLEDFFAIHPCFDFIWIELTGDLKNQCSLRNIKKIFDTFHAEERMPVVIVMYEEE